MRAYIVWVKGIGVALKIPTVNAFFKSSHELAKSRDESRNTLTLQFLACALHVTFASCITRKPSREINFTNLILNTLQINPLNTRK